MPASRVSQKLSGGPKAALARSNRSNEIDPTKIGSLTLNRDAIQALTIAQAKVQVTISAGGTTAVLVSEETGRQIGGLDDLAKLLGLRTFVTKEKKQSASSEAQEEVVLAAYRVNQMKVTQNPSFEPKKLDNYFVVAAKPYRNMAATIQKQLLAIMGNYHEDAGPWKKLLGMYCNGITNAISLTLGDMLEGEKEKGKMDLFLAQQGVPSYVKNKLQLKSLAISKDMDLGRILFPQDPSKGLSLTVSEWRDESLVKAQGGIMRHSEPIIRILKDEELFLELIGMSKEEFANAEDPRVQRVLKTRILVVPPYVNHKQVLEPLSRPNFRGFSLPATAMDQSRDRLSNLCAVFVRAYAFSIRMAETIPDFFDRVVEPGTVKPPDDKLGNYAKQLLQALEEGKEIKLFPKLQLLEPISAMMEWITRECKLIPNGSLYKKIERALTADKGGTAEYKAVSVEAAKAKPNLVARILDDVTTGTEKDEMRTFQEKTLSIKEKSLKTKRTVASSVLSKEAKAFLKYVGRNHSDALAISMESFFRGFYSEDIQSAAVRIAKARFDDLEESDDESSDSGDESSDEGET